MVSNNYIRVLTIKLDFDISDKEVPLLRGAIIASVGDDPDVILHNHLDENYRYSYPLVQYKRIEGKGAVVCINEGVEVIGELFNHGQTCLRIGRKVVSMGDCLFVHDMEEVQMLDDYLNYRITHWLPLNSDNYKHFQTLETIVERVQFLEHILKGNILSMCKGLGIFLADEIELDLTYLGNPVSVLHKGVKLLCFDADFRTNIVIPEYIGLGKNVSVGYGIITKKK